MKKKEGTTEGTEGHGKGEEAAMSAVGSVTMNAVTPRLPNEGMQSTRKTRMGVDGADFLQDGIRGNPGTIEAVLITWPWTAVSDAMTAMDMMQGSVQTITDDLGLYADYFLHRVEFMGARPMTGVIGAVTGSLIEARWSLQVEKV